MNDFLFENIITPFPAGQTMKSKIVIGNVIITVNKRFNRFQKLMLRFCFGFEVSDIREDSE